MTILAMHVTERRTRRQTTTVPGVSVSATGEPVPDETGEQDDRDDRDPAQKPPDPGSRGA